MDRGLLNKATTADAQPTPGYMYLEIAKMTYAPNGSHQLEDYLCNKIASKDDANVKFKCLRIIRNILDPDAQVQASMDFKKRMQRRADVVKSCRMFRGPVDPLRGDAPNKAVREEAEEALKMIFNETTIGQPSTAAPASHSGFHDRIKGFGSDGSGIAGPPPPPSWGGAAPQQQQQPLPYPGGVYPGPPITTGRMQGFGNPEFNDFNNSSSNQAGSTASAIAGKVGQAAASAASVLSSAYQRWHGGGSTVPSGGPQHSYSGYGPTPTYNGGYPSPQQGQYNNTYNQQYAADRGMWVPPSVDKSAAAVDRASVSAPPVEHRTAEYRLVSQLANGSVAVGVFLNRVNGDSSSEYDMNEIASELAARITKGPPQARLRALRAVEGLADKEEVRDICTECVSDPQGLPQICRATAARVSRALQGSGHQQQQHHRPAKAAEAATMPDLLDLGGGDTDDGKKGDVAKEGGDDDLLLMGEADLIDAAPIVKPKAGPEVDLYALNLGQQQQPAAQVGSSQTTLLPDLSPKSDIFGMQQSPSKILPTQQATTLLPDLAGGSLQTNGSLRQQQQQQQSFVATRSYSGGLDTPGGQQLDDIFAKEAAKAAAAQQQQHPAPSNVYPQQAAAAAAPAVRPCSSAFGFIGGGNMAASANRKR